MRRPLQDPVPQRPYETLAINAAGQVVVVAASLDQVKTKAISMLADWRWQKETGGITLPGGVRVTTDDTAQRKVSELRRRAEAGEITLPFGFKAASGWIDLDLATIIAVDQAISAHVQNCYAEERQHAAAVEAATTVAEIRAILDPLGI